MEVDSLMIDVLLRHAETGAQLDPGDHRRHIRAALTHLRRSIENLVGGEHARALYHHPLVKGLRKPKRLPSYLKPEIFAGALIEVVAQKQDGKHAFELSAGELRETITGRPGEADGLGARAAAEVPHAVASHHATRTYHGASRCVNAPDPSQSVSPLPACSMRRSTNGSTRLSAVCRAVHRVPAHPELTLDPPGTPSQAFV